MVPDEEVKRQDDEKIYRVFRSARPRCNGQLLRRLGQDIRL